MNFDARHYYKLSQLGRNAQRIPRPDIDIIRLNEIFRVEADGKVSFLHDSFLTVRNVIMKGFTNKNNNLYRSCKNFGICISLMRRTPQEREEIQTYLSSFKSASDIKVPKYNYSVLTQRNIYGFIGTERQQTLSAAVCALIAHIIEKNKKSES